MSPSPRAHWLATVAFAILVWPSAALAAPATRTINGSGNNVANPSWGTPGIHLLRGASGAHYADGISALGGATRPSPREISNTCFAQDGSTLNRRGVSDFGWTWGQFVDHDLDLTEGALEFAPIAVPVGDPDMDPLNTGAVVIPFRRALADPATGITTPREQVNEITGYLDASNVYGSDSGRAAWLRTFVGGRLKVTPTAQGDLLPFNDGTIPNAGSPEAPNLSPTLFVAGDIRANEQPTLASMHALFVREHNWQAARIAAQSPGLGDEDIYQRARKIVIAEIQSITYEEFLPAILGSVKLPPDHGYDRRVNPGIASAFSTAAFRIGHTMLSPVILRLGADGNPIPQRNLNLRDAFFAATPPMLLDHGIDPFMRGLAAQPMQELDAQVVDDVRNFLFGPPGAGGLDLIALNIQRGRDMGLPDFNTTREDYGLRRLSTFDQITRDPRGVAELESLYASVDDVDLFVGLLMEDDLPGAVLGETITAILADQFARLRDGDRFFYTRDLSGNDLARVRATRLSTIIERNTGVRGLQKDIFHVRGRGAATR